MTEEAEAIAESVDFELFGDAVAAQYDRMKQGELFQVDLEKDSLWETYLAGFPEGSNPIFRERTEHDCSCCKHFIRGLGGIVAKVDGEWVTVWDIPKVGWPYDAVASVMKERVRDAAIRNLFRTSEHQYGQPHSVEVIDEKPHRWNHFSGKIDKAHHAKDVGPILSKAESLAGVMLRGLEEITPDAVQDVLQLIESDSIYRGKENKSRVEAFANSQSDFRKVQNDRHSWVWERMASDSAHLAIRNTAIGTLLVDLSEGTPLEKSVAKYEAKVAPENYKRSKALVTPQMIEKALEKIDELGLRSALSRRHARLGDVSVNDVLFVNNDASEMMKDSLKDSLLTGAKKPTSKKSAKPSATLSSEQFISEVLPNSSEIELLVENSHQPNFVSLTAPMEEDAKGLFQWDNNFAWSYSGGLADASLREKVAAAGGRVDGDFRFSHSWNRTSRNASLMDLHVFFPGNWPGNVPDFRDGMVSDSYGTNQRIGWNNRNHQNGGSQDVDYVHPAPEGYVPVENITFPKKGRMPEGRYLCAIHNWRFRSPTLGGFEAEIEFGGEVFSYAWDKPMEHKEWRAVAWVTLKDGEFSIEHAIPCDQSSQSIWGVDTKTFVPVESIMRSPNFWNGSKNGNEHLFFILRGCRNPDPVRGIYNEFLSSELHEHRKVLELVGEKTLCEPSADQLSGVGFSSTQRKTVSLRVADRDGGRREYEVNF